MAERVHEAVGPRGKYGPNPIVSSLAALTQPKTASKARVAMGFMMNQLGFGWLVPARQRKFATVRYCKESASVGNNAK